MRTAAMLAIIRTILKFDASKILALSKNVGQGAKSSVTINGNAMIGLPSTYQIVLSSHSEISSSSMPISAREQIMQNRLRIDIVG